MRVIGITGPSGSGKTVLTEYFSGLGIPTIDADALYHSMLIPPSKCLDAISEVFGNSVIAPDGTLDRAALSSIVFSDKDKLRLLNETVLRIVIARIRELISELESDGHTCVLVDAPTLIEAKFDTECDTVIVVTAPQDERVHRIMNRDGIEESRARERVMAQKPDKFYTAVADYVINNNDGEAQFLEQIKNLAVTLSL